MPPSLSDFWFTQEVCPDANVSHDKKLQHKMANDNPTTMRNIASSAFSFLQELEDSTSPTKELLKIWEEKSHGCIRSFVATAVKINRLDVAEKVEEHIGTLYLETLPNHKCNQHC